MKNILSEFWHGTLRRPYRLAKTVDQGSGPTVVLLHGIGRSSGVWKHVVERLQPQAYRTVAFDMLGFGSSPKPRQLEYSTADHAAAVIAGLERLRSKAPVILVGHSMGCLVAVRVAKLRPDLVKHLVLYEMPLYEGLPNKKRYRWRLDLYFKIYEQVVRYQPTFNDQTARLAERLGRRIAGFELSAETWLPFAKSLQHTILQQTTVQDMKAIAAPIDVIYGSFDMFVIRGKPQQTFGTETNLVSAHTIRARHDISTKASTFIVERINALQYPESVAPRKRISTRLTDRARYAAKRTR